MKPWMGSALAILAVCSGCQSHHFVARNAVKQITTINDILEQEVVDNIAGFAANRGAMPYFAVVGDGTAQVTDSGSMTPTIMFNAIRFSGANLNFSASRGLQENWKLSPCMTAGRLARLRCAFQFIFSHPVPEVIDDKAKGTSRVQINEGCFKCVEEIVRVGVLPTPIQPSTDQTTPPKAIVPEPDGGWDFKSATAKDSHDAAVDYAGKLQQGLDCAFPTGWFGVGHKHDVPKCACYSSSVCDTYVWVEPDGADALARFTITVIALATIDPIVQVPNYTFAAAPKPPSSDAALRSSISNFSNAVNAHRQTNQNPTLQKTLTPSLTMLDDVIHTGTPSTSQLLNVRHMAETAISEIEQTGVPGKESQRLLDSAHQVIGQIDEYLTPGPREVIVPVQPQIIPNAYDQPGSMPFSRGGGIEFFPQPAPTQ